MSYDSCISPDQLKELIETESIEELSTDQLLLSFLNDSDINYDPIHIRGLIDPRNSEPVIFNPLRSARPRNNSVKDNGSSTNAIACPICAGNTTRVLDITELSKGFTFINKNLFPVLCIPDNIITSLLEQNKPSQEVPIWGLHFVQWTSSYHELDWHNMPFDDCHKVMIRLAALEKKLSKVGLEISHRLADNNQTDPWSVSIIKNVGAAVGGSLEHGHQQIILSNILPKRISDDITFHKKHKATFSNYLLSKTPTDLCIRDFGPAVLLVPYYMRRPYNMILVLKNQDVSFMHEMNHNEIKAVAKGWKEATNIINKIMPSLNKEVAYNIATHNTSGSGLYFEFLPFTQARGGLEHLGLSVCQAEAYQVAEQIRKLID